LNGGSDVADEYMENLNPNYKDYVYAVIDEGRV